MMVALLAVTAIGTGLWRLESASADLEVERTRVGAVPVTLYRPASTDPSPVVLIAHGFSGSQQLMQSFAITLARNGFLALTFDFPGHGRNPVPFVTSIEDQDRRVGLLLGALQAVADFADDLPGSDGTMALLGHSMAGDVLVRYASGRRDSVAATVLVSPYLAEDAPTAEPRNLLLIYGALEPEALHEAGRRALADAAGGGVETDALYGDFADGSARRLVLAAGTEHIGVLYGQAGLRAALDWLNRAFEREGGAVVDDRGPALGLLFLGILALAWPLSRLLPRAATAPMGAGLRWRHLWPAAAAPALLTPLLLRPLPTDYLPVLLGDYLALHFAVYGLLTALALAAVRRSGRVMPAAAVEGRLLVPGLVLATLAACLYSTLAFALPLDRYVTAYLPDSARLWVLAAVLPGTWAWFAADGWLTHGPGAPRSAPAVTKVLFLLSLMLAVALNLRELFFLIIVLPAILAFFVVFGVMGHWAYRRTRHPLVGSVAGGLAFAWAIAATFPVAGG
jgi:dienelactone hydrolase